MRVLVFQCLPYRVRTYRTAEVARVETITVNKFRENLREQIEKVLSEHEPLKVTRRNGGDFVVVGLED
jgi:prevent-host-death family protein